MILNFEHFDLYGLDEPSLYLRGYSASGNNPLLINTVSRTGTHSLRMSSSGGVFSFITYALPGTARTTCGQGCGFQVTSSPNATSPSGTPGLFFGDASSISAIRCIIGQNNTLCVYQGATLRGTSSVNVFTFGAWFWLEAKVIIGAGATSSVEIRVNGASVLLVTGLTIASNITRCSFGTAGSNSGWGLMYVDDWVIWDTAGSVNNDWLGDTFVIVSDPESDATANDWVASTGTTKWPLVDERTPSDTDFITGNAVNDTQELEMASVSLPSTGGIIGVASQARAFKSDAGSSTITIGVASASSNNSSAGINLGTGAQVFSHLAEVNPDGGIGWTVSTAQAARFRVRRTA
jgi:hypothetical protein